SLAAGRGQPECRSKEHCGRRSGCRIPPRNSKGHPEGIMAQEQALVAGVLDRAVAVTLLENFVTHDIRPIEAARTKDEACDSCCKNPAAGFGIAARQSGLKAQP